MASRRAARKKSTDQDSGRPWTPMLRHYLQVKSENSDAVVLYRMGDFYETFFEDAEVAAPIFEIQLTARHRGTENEVPMCGVPHHAIEGYIGKLLAAGRKVAVCDQVEDPAQAKGLVKREVTRVVTPGTVSALELLESREPNYLTSLHWGAKSGAGACLDLSTGTFFLRRWADVDAAREDLARWNPRELVLSADTLPGPLLDWIEASGRCTTYLAPDLRDGAPEAADRLRRHFGVQTLRGLGLEDGEAAVEAAAFALAYAAESSRSAVQHVQSLRVLEAEDQVILDESTLRNLEILRNGEDGGRRHTLLWAIDRTKTGAGARQLQRWLGEPLRDRSALDNRLDAVEELMRDSLRDAVRSRLGRLPDFERLATRAVVGALTPAETAALRDGLAEVPELFRELDDSDCAFLNEIRETSPQSDLLGVLQRTLADEPAASLRAGGVIKSGYDEELDRVCSLARDSKTHLLEIERRERQATGIPSLKVRFNRVFGYYLEVTKANISLVPERFHRKQTLANAERYITEELKELEVAILQAEERQLELETAIFETLREAVAQQAAELVRLGAATARLDVVAGLAEVAAVRGYRRPSLVASGQDMVLRDARHAVIEQTHQDPFVPNDVELSVDGEQIILLTGPNMGGKSTFLRQCGLIVLLAHIGSFVPASSAQVPIVDRIFTRVGASDRLSRGESTFMVEMIETSNILRYATAESLVILDEVGRGTATYDGLSLAWAIVEYLHEEVGARTLFATHYHELTTLSTTLARVANHTMTVREWQDRIIFLHRVQPGSADKSYGLHVARLAGLPESVLERAQEVLANLESESVNSFGKPRIAQGELAPRPQSGPDQMSLFQRTEDIVADLVRELDIERLTPLAALNLLQTLQERLSGGRLVERSGQAGDASGQVGGPSGRVGRPSDTSA